MLEVRTWEAQLDAWLEPFPDALGHKAPNRNDCGYRFLQLPMLGETVRPASRTIRHSSIRAAKNM